MNNPGSYYVERNIEKRGYEICQLRNPVFVSDLDLEKLDDLQSEGLISAETLFAAINIRRK